MKTKKKLRIWSAIGAVLILGAAGFWASAEQDLTPIINTRERALLPIAASAALNETPAKRTRWKITTNKRMGIQIQHPDDWIVTSTESQQTTNGKTIAVMFTSGPGLDPSR